MENKIITNANDILFRCSGLGYIQVEPQNKSELIADTTKTHLIDLFVSAVYNRREQIQSKYLLKGNECEEDSITLLSRVLKYRFKKNSERLNNEFITGEPDLFTGLVINEADEIFDTKSSWSAHTFFRAQANLNKMYEWQGHGYMWLTGAKKCTIAYCLVNGTADAIMNEKRQLSYQKGMLDGLGNESELFKRKCKQIEINHIFDLELFHNHYPGFEYHNDIDEWRYDIPMEKRVFCHEFNRSDEHIASIRAKIRLCRNWMNRELFKI